MKIVTIDFDIIMSPCIDVYNDSDLTVDEYLNKFDFLGWMAADLELYQILTNFVMSFDKSKIYFIYDHHDIVDHLKDIEEKIDLYNIDYHHDIGYEDEKFWNSPLQEYNEGNWVKRLWDENKLNSYIWLKDYKSYDLNEKGEKYLTDSYIVYNYNLKELLDADALYISLSAPWVPEYYTYLYNLWEDLTNMK